MGDEDEAGRLYLYPVRLGAVEVPVCAVKRWTLLSRLPSAEGYETRT